jgi:hypothetical protein
MMKTAPHIALTRAVNRAIAEGSPVFVEKRPLTMAPNTFERVEWARCASAARMAGLTSLADRLDEGVKAESLPLARFDTLSRDYRAWLCFGFTTARGNQTRVLWASTLESAKRVAAWLVDVNGGIVLHVGTFIG